VIVDYKNVFHFSLASVQPATAILSGSTSGMIEVQWH